jgi:glutathione peroxidase-family protein
MKKENNHLHLTRATRKKEGRKHESFPLTHKTADVKTAHPSDFEILAFPCNQFGGQDPGSNEEIQNFCVLGHKVTYKVLGKTEVNGNSAEPVWEWMKKEKPGLMGLQRVKWNFEKFLIGKDGKVKGRWASTTKPDSIKSAIEAEFKA